MAIERKSKFFYDLLNSVPVLMRRIKVQNQSANSNYSVGRSCHLKSFRLKLLNRTGWGVVIVFFLLFVRMFKSSRGCRNDLWTLAKHSSCKKSEKLTESYQKFMPMSSLFGAFLFKHEKRFRVGLRKLSSLSDWSERRFFFFVLDKYSSVELWITDTAGWYCGYKITEQFTDLG